MRLRRLAAEEAARRARLGLGLSLFELLAQVGDLALGGVQRLVGQDGVLDQHIGRVRMVAQDRGDQVVGLGVLHPGRGLDQVLQEALQQGAFVGGHGWKVPLRWETGLARIW